MEDATTERPRDLPVIRVGAVRPRADAVRNRARVLAAAQRLFAARGVTDVSMDDVAAAAGVGKGTLYRRFGDKSGLVAALLDERESELQARMLTGPAPLGPGGQPVDRLVTFVTAYLEYVDSHLDLVALSQTASPGARLRTGAHRFWRQHCRILFADAGAADPDLRADTLLAALSAEQVRQWRRVEGRPLAALTRSLATIVRALAARPGSA